MKCPYSFVIDTPGEKAAYRRREYSNPFDITTGYVVPCGKCIICRLNRSAEWSARLVHELQYHSQGCFLTLTYDNENVPFWSSGLLSLYKPDVQRFIKRLRKALGKTKIKYFCAGEYGSLTKRPHYHMIIFGWHPPLQELFRTNTGGWSHEKLEDIWSHGTVQIGSVTNESIYYTAGYILKSTFPKNALLDRSKEFLLCSKGLGLSFCLDNSDKIKNMDITAEGRTISVPRYYIKKVGPVIQEFKEVKTYDTQIAFLKRALYQRPHLLSPDELQKVQELVSLARLQNEKNMKSLLAKSIKSGSL